MQGEGNVGVDKHTLVVVNPGHFHAALTLRLSHPRLADDVYVYAEEGPDLERFVAIVEQFNARPSRPTRWTLHVHRGADYLERACTERRGRIAIVAGRNDEKMRSIERLQASGFAVLADKPWIICRDQLESLRAVASSSPPATDIMTERYEVANRLQRALMQEPQVFGELRRDGPDPAIWLESVHHLYKLVNGRPLVRPAWYFDTGVQGEGITDVNTHLADLAQWMITDDGPLDYTRDVEIAEARQWPTPVPRDVFARITGLTDFPEALRADVEGDALQFLCNAQISYRLRGISVRIDALWALAIPEGGGDTHRAVVRGTHAELVVEQGRHTGFVTELSVRPLVSGTAYTRELERAINRLQAEFPGVGLEAAGNAYRVTIPSGIRTTHEEHFAKVLDRFLDDAERGRLPDNAAADLIAKYSLLVDARELSRQGTRA